jgi:N-acetylneuraminic acid mutarotase
MAPQGQGDTWTKKADMPTGRGGLSTCAVNGKIYAIGGVIFDNAGNQKSLSTVEEYDPKTDTWTKKSDISTARFFFAACEVNGKIYVIGGLNSIDGNFKDLLTMEEYDPDIDKWTQKTDMPTSRYWLSASAVNGKIYAIGGLKANNGPLSTVEEYDPVRDKWTRKTDLPRQIHTLSTSTVNSKIYGIGGVDNGVLLSTVYEYDPLLDSWTRKADMPTARTRACSSAVNGRIYVIGGYDRVRDIDLTSVEEYDPVLDSWTKKTDMPNFAEDHACSPVNGKIYVIGGANNPTLVEEYDTGFAGEGVNFKGKLPSTWGDVKLARNK